MPVSYKREMNHNYMIINSTKQASFSYECNMLSGNSIEGLLRFRIGHQEDNDEFFYEITSKQPLSRVLDQRTITGREIKSMLLSIAATLQKIEEYLLREDQIMLEPDYIYVEPDRFNVYLCMVPGYTCDFPSAVTALFAYLIGKVNHQDNEGVVLAYNLYHESLKENYSLSDLLGQLSKNKGGVFGRGEMEFSDNKAENRERYRDEEMNIAVSQNRGFTEPMIRTGGMWEEEKGAGEQKYVGRKSSEKSVERTDNTGGREREVRNGDFIYSFGAVLLKSILLLGAAELFLWAIKGEEGVWQYGLPAGAAVFLAGILFFTAGNRKGGGVKEANNREDKAQEKEVWRVIPEENAFRDWTEQNESDSMEENKENNVQIEPETTLLTEKKNNLRHAVLESLNRERESITVSYVPFVIGKHSELADYCLQQPTVSRLHIKIDQKEGVYLITDLNSTNGTIVEGYQLQANETVSLKNGDTVYIADAGYRFINFQ